MKRLMWTALMVVGCCLVSSGAHASWDTCGGCHNGALAKDKKQLLAKYTTAEALIKGAQDSESPMMSRIKQDIEGLKAAAAELGLNAEQKAD